jgi:hypothetical protein
MALTDEIFGRPRARDAALVTRVADKETARCQLEMLKRVGKLEYTVLKELYKAKKRAIKDETVNGDTALEEKLRVVFSANAKVDRARDKLVSRVDKRCAVLPAPPDAIFPGYGCGAVDPNLSDVEDCAIAAARCEACLEINAFDGLDLGCDWADDQTANGSCS